MSMGSKVRMTLAGLTAVALIGGVMAADPADANKKRRHHKKSSKSVKISQNARGGDAEGGNGGHGGNGGNAFNFGGGGTPGTPATGPGVGVTNAQLACAAAVLVNPAAGPFTPGNIVNALTTPQPPAAPVPCFPGTPPAAFVECLVAASQAGGITAAEVIACGAVTPGTPGTVGGGGAVGGAGGNGAPGGAAIAGNGGANVINIENDDD